MFFRVTVQVITSPKAPLCRAGSLRMVRLPRTVCTFSWVVWQGLPVSGGEPLSSFTVSSWPDSASALVARRKVKVMVSPGARSVWAELPVRLMVEGEPGVPVPGSA